MKRKTNRIFSQEQDLRIQRCITVSKLHSWDRKPSSWTTFKEGTVRSSLQSVIPLCKHQHCRVSIKKNNFLFFCVLSRCYDIFQQFSAHAQQGNGDWCSVQSPFSFFLSLVHDTSIHSYCSTHTDHSVALRKMPMSQFLLPCFQK